MNIIRQLSGKGDTSDLKIGCFELWKKVFLDSKKLNESEYSERRTYNLYSDNGAIFSGRDNVAFFYTIDGYPKELMIDFKKVLRREVNKGVMVSFISTFEPTAIDWNSAQIKSKLKTWKAIDEDMGDVDEFNMRENISSLDNNLWRKQSLMYLSDAEARRQRKLFKYRTMMIVSGVRGEEFDNSVEKIEDYCKKIGLTVTRVVRDLDNFLNYFSPFSLELNTSVLKEVGNTTIPDEMIARLSNYEQGKVGNGNFYWGMDIFSGFPVFKSIKKHSVDAENILITGETGSGKSFFGKGLILLLIANPNINGTIMDIEGFEYLPIGGFLANNDKVVVLNMAEGQGKYYDPVEIIKTGDYKLDKDMFSFSKSFTLSILQTLTGARFIEENEWADIIINDSVSKTYSDRGVTLDMETWENSKGLTLFDVYENMKKLYSEVLNISDSGKVLDELTQQYKMNEGYKYALDLVIAKLSKFFEPLEKGGTRSDLFKDRVTLEDIIDAKLVICSFGMAGKSPETVDKVHMALSQLSAANISHLRSIFSQFKGKYNFKVWEEFQRWGAFPGSEKTISTALTGGRKLGDINFIITNRPQELLDNDRFGIFGNTTSFAIGAIDDSKTRNELCERLSIPLLKPDLDKIVTKAGSENISDGDNFVEEVSSIYDHAFLVKLDKSLVTISKMVLPEHIEKSSLLRTGDMEQMKRL